MRKDRTSAVVLLVEHANAHYDRAERPALANVSLELRPSDVVHVVGPAGSGKTTLCDLACGTCSPLTEVTGRIEILGRPHARLTPENPPPVARLFEDAPASFCTLTPFEEVSFALENLARPAADISSRTSECLREVGLADFEHRPYVQLSGGQQHLMAWAALLARDDVWE